MRDHAVLDRLYVAIRGDLPLGLAAAQAVHAAFAFSKAHPQHTATWLHDSQFLVLVTTPDEPSLIRLASQALAAGIDIAMWSEPDMADAHTALVLEPGDTARRLCGSLPLLGRPLAAA